MLRPLHKCKCVCVCEAGCLRIGVHYGADINYANSHQLRQLCSADRQQCLSTLPLYLKLRLAIRQDRDVTNYMIIFIHLYAQTTSLSKAPVSGSVRREHK